MTKKIPRRTFFKIAAGAAAVSGLSPRVRRLALEPFVRPPEELLPGQATWYASTCRQCPAGCGIIVRVINGRAKKIEGNPTHPLNQGKLCARGQAGLQVLYNPDRLQNAVAQTGGRGSHIFEPLYWTEALNPISAALQRLKDPNSLAVFSGYPADHLYALWSAFLQGLGSPMPVVFDLQSELDGRASAVALSERWFGERVLPRYDLAQAQVVLSFGANLFETWMSPVAQSAAYGELRQGHLGGRGVLIQIEPRMSATGASADEWIPIRPGTEGIIALALGRIIVEENLGRVGKHVEYAPLYRNVDISAAAEAGGIPLEALTRLAHLFSDVDRPLAIPGGQLSGHANQAPAMDAVMALNIVMRRLGKPGGIFLPQPVPGNEFGGGSMVSTYGDVQELISRMQAGEVEVLFVHGANPAYDLPASSGFKEAIQNVPLVVSFASFVDETAALADFILPDHTYLESWGYHLPSPAADRPVISGLQPVVQPLYDTRATADVLLELARRIGGKVAAALPWPDEAAFLEERAATLHNNSLSIFDARTAGGFWGQWRQHGGWWSKRPIQREPVLSMDTHHAISIPDPEYAGDEASYPFYLILYPSITLSDGRGANQPWLQEAPDPMTTARWNTWVEINPLSAHEMGLEDNDLVDVISPAGRLRAAVVLYPGIRPDAIAVPLGQGHEDFGRYAAGRGSNAIQLLPSPIQPEAVNLAQGAVRVRIEKVGATHPLARMEALDGEGRENVR